MSDVFRAGVEPGGLTTDYELKMLICYILNQIDRPMPVSALIEVIIREGIGNYFETASAASNLVKNGHLTIETSKDNQRCYAITPLGASAADTFEKDLPLSVRDKALESAHRYFTIQERRAQNSTEIKKVEDGYLLILTIKDVGSDLLKLTILLPDLTSCERIKTRFLSDPIVVYKGVVALLTGNYNSVGSLLDDSNKIE